MTWSPLQDSVKFRGGNVKIADLIRRAHQELCQECRGHLRRQAARVLGLILIHIFTTGDVSLPVLRRQMRQQCGFQFTLDAASGRKSLGPNGTPRLLGASFPARPEEPYTRRRATAVSPDPKTPTPFLCPRERHAHNHALPGFRSWTTWLPAWPAKPSPIVSAILSRDRFRSGSGSLLRWIYRAVVTCK